MHIIQRPHPRILFTPVLAQVYNNYLYKAQVYFLYIIKKELTFCYLCVKYNSSLPNTKPRENRVEYVFVGDFPCNRSELIEGCAQVNRKNITRQPLINGIQGMLHMLFRFLKAVAVAG